MSLFPMESFYSPDGRLYSQRLFYELSNDKDVALYTLGEKDKTIVLDDGSEKILLSIKRIYLEMMDYGEFEFANRCFTSYKHWDGMVRGNASLRSHVVQWRYELEKKMVGLGVQGAIDEIKGDTKNKWAAAKWLGERKFLVEKDESGNTKRGRPSNNRAAAQDRELKSEYADDLARLGLQ